MQVEIAESSPDSPGNYQGTLDGLKYLKGHTLDTYQNAVNTIRGLLAGTVENKSPSGYDGWSPENLRKLLKDLGEAE